MVSHHPAKFTGHKYCCNEDVVVLVCKVILQDHVTKGSGNFMARRTFRYVMILSSLVAIGTLVEETKHFEFFT